MARSKNMTMQEFRTFCIENNLDPETGSRIVANRGVQYVHYVDSAKVAQEFDEWAEKMRAQERSTHRKIEKVRKW